MTLQDASNIASVISAVAVVISLIYVGIEIRHNSRVVQLATQQTQADSTTNYLIPIALDPVFGDIAGRALAGETLTPLDHLRLGLMMNGVFAQFQAGYEAVQSNPKALRSWWAYREESLASWLLNPIFQAWWRSDRHLFSDGFAALVDRKLDEIAATQRAGAAPQ